MRVLCILPSSILNSRRNHLCGVPLTTIEEKFWDARAVTELNTLTDGRSTEGYMSEIEELAHLADMAAAHAPSHARVFQELMRSTRRCIETETFDLFAIETALDDATRDFRIACLRAAHDATDQTLRSPTRDEEPRGPGGRRVSFGYERDLDPSVIEQRLAQMQPCPKTWQCAHLAFSSGQSAMACIAIATSELFPRVGSHRPLRILHYGGYFETAALFRVYERSGLYCYDSWGATQILPQESPDVVVFEPVYYDGLNCLRAGEIATLRQLVLEADKPIILIIDTTLVGLAFPLDSFLAVLPGFNGLVIALRSGLKLDQAGLELANVGVVTIFAKTQSDISVGDLAGVLREVRTLTGANLSFDALNALGFPWCLNASYMSRYCSQIFANNAQLASALNEGGTFGRVAHPRRYVDAPDWAQAPFCVLQLRDNRPENYRGLADHILEAARRRRIKLDQGGSFGFRGHRFDVILPEDETPPFIRIAMGYRRGAGLDEVIRLWKDL
jgi:hypothetical protein